MCAPDMPEPPSPRETSAAQTSTNVGTAIANAYLGNVNRVGPDGTTSFDQTGSFQWNDPYTGKSYTIPRFTETVELTPEGQAVFDANQGTKLNLAELGQQQSGFLQDYMGTPFDYNPGEHEGWALGLYDQLSAEKLQDDSQALRSRLAAQGIKLGSEAYGDAMSSFREGTSNARNQFLLDSYRTGFSTAQAERNQPINEITALLSGSQVSTPSFSNNQMPQMPTTDVAGLINENYNQQMGQYQAAVNSRNDLLGGLFGVGAAFAGNPSLAFSDRRVKKNIEKVGKHDGLSLYSYNYKGEPKGAPKHTGVMAQNVERSKRKHAVKNVGGIKAVDYGELFGVGV